MKFRYLLILFLLNFIFVKKSLAADACGDNALTCSTTTQSLTNGSRISTNDDLLDTFTVVYEFRALNSTLTNNANIIGTTVGVSFQANNGSLSNNSLIEATSGIGVRFAAPGGTATTGGIINNNSGGTIKGTTAGVYIYKSSSDVIINNEGTIQGTAASSYAISNEGTLTINNEATGTITSSLYRTAINNYGALTINNSGTISSLATTGRLDEGTIYHWGTAFNLTNETNGVISSIGTNNPAIGIESGTASVVNRGVIQATGSGSDANAIYNQASNITIENYGSITSTSGKSIVNRDGWGTVSLLKNAQTGLTYQGSLPATYKIILGTNASLFGTLVISSPSGSITTFGIDSGTVKSNKYAAVISGLSTTYLSAQTGTYGGYSWSLDLQSGSLTTWDLSFPSYVSGPSSADTDTSLLTVASNLKGVINYQNSSLNHSLNYDCSYFGKSNSCISSSVRNSNTKDNDSQSVAIIAATKIGDQVRVGVFIDGTVNKDHNFNMKLNSNSPMFGVFTRFNQYDQNFGLKGGVSAGYIDQDLKSTRVATGTSEPGTGTSNLNTKGIQAEIQYGIDAASFLTVSPYVGYRNTQTTRDKYTEETSSTVTTPLTYNKIKQTEETAFAGIELKSHFHTTDKFATLNLGYEHAAKFSIDNLSTSGVSGTSDVNLGSNIDKTRPIIMASLNQDLGTSGRLSLHFDRRQQVYSPTNSTNVALQYAVGF